MSDVRDPDTDQPLPVITTAPFVQDEVIADIEQRKALGIRKYGTALQAGNGRDMLLDAYEEALDLVIYLRGALDEQQSAGTVEWGIRDRITPGAVFVRVDEAAARRDVEFRKVMADGTDLWKYNPWEVVTRTLPPWSPA